jgi:Zn-dependent protease with chaperone function
MYFALGITLLFALLLVLNLLASVFASLIWRVIAAPTAGLQPRTRSQIILGLRVLPVALAAILVFAYLLPAYLLFEPDKSNETISVKLAAIALLSLIGISLALYRVFKTWKATARLAAGWMEDAEAVELPGVSIPAYAIRHPYPLIAVVGMVRPKMFIARQIFDLLDENEFRAAIAHEQGHLATRDNLKRTALRVCRDLLVFPLGKRLDADWAENAECGADDYAAEVGDKHMAVDLASALVKIARVVPENAYPAMPSGSFLIDHNASGIGSRVRRLLDSRRRGIASARRLPIGWVGAAAAVAVLSVFALNEDVLFRVHSVMESFVSLLQ